MGKEINKNRNDKEVSIIIDSLDEINKKFITTKEESKKLINDTEEVKKKLNEASEKVDKLKNGPFNQILEDFLLMIDIIGAYINNEYKEIPFGSIIAILAAIIYVVNPLDILPDVIPGIGLIDDAFVVALVIKQVHADLQNYKLWKENNK